MIAFLGLWLAIAPGLSVPDPSEYAWRTHTGTRLDGSTMLADETGRQVRLSNYLHGLPVILDLGYFHCPTLCGVVRADLLHALPASGLAPGQAVVLSISIDPAETPADAARAQAQDRAREPAAPHADWHYLTGNAAAIGKLEQTVGFRDAYDPALRQFLHPTGLVMLTPSGVVSGYVLGVGYTGGDLRAAVLRASVGGLQRALLPVLLLCFHFDSTTGRYTLAIMKLLRLMGLFTVLTIGALLWFLHRRPARSAP